MGAPVKPLPPPGRLTLAAFQIDANALYAIHYGARKLASGLAAVTWPNPKQIRIGDALTFDVDSIVDDPKLVGKFKNQHRVHVTAHIDLPADEIEEIAAAFAEEKTVKLKHPALEKPKR